jgi:hypothetical protein
MPRFRVNLSTLVGVILLLGSVSAALRFAYQSWVVAVILAGLLVIGLLFWWAFAESAARLRRPGVLVGLFVAAVLAYLAFFPLGGALWVGFREVTLDIAAFDSDTGRPLAGAVVRLVPEEGDSNVVEAQAGADGKARLKNRFWASGQSNILRQTGGVRFTRWWLEVLAAGHRPLRILLAEHTGPGRDINNPAPPPIRVELQTDSRSVEAYFRSVDEAGQTLNLDAEGRFSIETRISRGVFDRQEGTYEFREGQFELKGVAQKQPQDFARLTGGIILVRWGDRRYLIAEWDHWSFCDAIRSGEEPRGRSLGRFFLREGDWEKPVVGLPDVPEEWRSFLPQGQDTGPRREPGP